MCVYVCVFSTIFNEVLRLNWNRDESKFVYVSFRCVQRFLRKKALYDSKTAINYVSLNRA